MPEIEEKSVEGPSPRSYFDDVGYFHAKFELPLAYAFVGTDRYGGERRWPGTIPTQEWMYRADFMDEELVEFRTACNTGNLHDAADALADLVWVALGTAHHLGLPFEHIWAEVKRANMEKEVGPPDATHKRPGERIRKPAGWRAPDHGPALVAYRGTRPAVPNPDARSKGAAPMRAEVSGVPTRVKAAPCDEFAEAHGGRRKNMERLDSFDVDGISGEEKP